MRLKDKVAIITGAAAALVMLRRISSWEKVLGSS